VNEQEIKSELRRLAPFHHLVELPYGLTTYIPELSRRDIERTRLPNLYAHLWPSLLELCGGSLKGRRILDVACNCGGFSVEAARSGADFVLGIDVVDRYLEQAEFIKRALALDNVEFRKLAMEEIESEEIGSFDVSFCFGILYHLENPVLAMKKLADVTTAIMVVDTTVDPTRPKDPYWKMTFKDPILPEAKSVSTALWIEEKACQLLPTAQAVRELLTYLGFSQVELLDPTAAFEQRYHRGNRATFLAVRS
jgi:2-polyprenyl-3-methyl-5-hydroxy-6-metoxy-1,4-benzoquinol methylase